MTATATCRPLRVFLVENHPDTLIVFTRYLKRRGHDVSAASTVKDALAAVPASNCDMLISDIGLPDGDGWQLLQQLQLSRPIFAVAMSGFGTTADRARSKEAGYRHHLLKPVKTADLDRILEEAARELDGE